MIFSNPDLWYHMWNIWLDVF